MPEGRREQDTEAAEVASQGGAPTSPYTFPNVGTEPVLAGHGMGLPLSRIYARYFGGDLEVCVCTYIAAVLSLCVGMKKGDRTDGLQDLRPLLFGGLGGTCSGVCGCVVGEACNPAREHTEGWSDNRRIERHTSITSHTHRHTHTPPASFSASTHTHPSTIHTHTKSQVKSLEGFGMDSYLHLCKLGHRCEDLGLQVRVRHMEKQGSVCKMHVHRIVEKKGACRV